jgi:hypothetical protein
MTLPQRFGRHLRFATSFLLATGLLPSLLTPAFAQYTATNLVLNQKRQWNEPGGSGLGQRLGHHRVGDEPVLAGRQRHR